MQEHREYMGCHRCVGKHVKQESVRNNLVARDPLNLTPPFQGFDKLHKALGNDLFLSAITIEPSASYYSVTYFQYLGEYSILDCLFVYLISAHQHQ